MQFSVLMSIYYKEKPEYAKECFESLLKQTVPADEWIIVEDGPLTDELYALLDEYQNNYPELIKRVPLSENKGLGNALNVGITHCTYDVIARMDTDDICVPRRFEEQLKILEESGADIVGGNIEEFIDSPDNIVAKRTVPTTDEEIKAYMKKRCPFNHVTVMFKKEAVLSSGNYQEWHYHEDDYLWLRMLLNGCKMLNTGSTLVIVRVGKDMYRRRGGLKYYKVEKQLQKFMRKNGIIGRMTYFSNCTKRFIVQVLMPNWLRGWVFRKFAREKVDKKA